MSKFFGIIKNGVRFKNNKLPASYPKLKGNFSKNVETVGTACQKSGGYTKGRLFLNSDGNLYRTKTDIAYGATLVNGTNCEPFDLDGAYSELNADIASETVLTTTLQTGISGTVKMVNIGKVYGYAEILANITSSTSANTQINLAIDNDSSTYYGLFNAKVTNSGGVVQGNANIYIVTGGGKRYVQCISDVTIPAGGMLIGSGIYCHK